ncbi:MAG: LamG domain-containing protein, partial [Planctomycetota bacterium]
TRTVPMDARLGGLDDEFFANAADRGIKLDGSSSVRVDSDAFALPADSPFTLECTFTPDEATLTGTRGLVAKTQSSEFALFLNDGVPQFDVHLIAPGAGAGSYRTAFAKTAMQAGTTYRLAGVWDGKEVRLYVDGVLAGSVSGVGKRTPNDLPLYLGADPGNRGEPTRPISGVLNDVRLSKVARTISDTQTPLTADDDTVLFFSLDRRIGPFFPGQGTAGVVGRAVGDVEFAE